MYAAKQSEPSVVNDSAGSKEFVDLHRSEKITDIMKKGRCKLCSMGPNKCRRAETCYGCRYCRIRLCRSFCHEKYHAENFPNQPTLVLVQMADDSESRLEREIVMDRPPDEDLHPAALQHLSQPGKPQVKQEFFVTTEPSGEQTIMDISKYKECNSEPEGMPKDAVLGSDGGLVTDAVVGSRGGFANGVSNNAASKLPLQPAPAMTNSTDKAVKDSRDTEQKQPAPQIRIKQECFVATDIE